MKGLVCFLQGPDSGQASPMASQAGLVADLWGRKVSVIQGSAIPDHRRLKSKGDSRHKIDVRRQGSSFHCLVTCGLSEDSLPPPPTAKADSEKVCSSSIQLR